MAASSASGNGKGFFCGMCSWHALRALLSYTHIYRHSDEGIDNEDETVGNEVEEDDEQNLDFDMPERWCSRRSRNNRPGGHHGLALLVSMISSAFNIFSGSRIDGYALTIPASWCMLSGVRDGGPVDKDRPDFIVCRCHRPLNGFFCRKLMT